MRLGQLAGIPVFLHWSFLLLMAVFAAQAWQRGGASEVVWTLGIDAGLFASVLLHEFGHAFAARGFGIKTRDITLYPFGGIASLTAMPRTPWQELVVSIAGPAVNGLLAIGLGVAWMGTDWLPLGLLAAANLFMGVFNLLPAYPMDGGRVLRALLVPGMGYAGASRLAMRVGRGFAWGFIALALVSGWWSLALVGGFLLLALRGEAAQAAARGPSAWRHGYAR